MDAFLEYRATMKPAIGAAIGIVAHMATVEPSVLVPLATIALGAMIAAGVALDRSRIPSVSKRYRLAVLVLSLTFIGLFIASWLSVEEEHPWWWTTWLSGLGIVLGVHSAMSNRTNPRVSGRQNRKGILIYLGLVLILIALFLTADAIRS